MPKWAKDEVQEATGGSLPEGLATVKVMSQEETFSRNEKLGIKVLTKVTNFVQSGKPAPQFKGMQFTFTFWIGTDTDKGAQKKETWLASFGAKRYKSYLKAARIPIIGDTDEEAETAKGAQLMIQVGSSYYDDPNGAVDEQGNAVKRRRAEASQFFPIGGESHSEDSVANGLDKNAKRVAPVAAARKVAAVEEYVEDDE